VPVLFPSFKLNIILSPDDIQQKGRHFSVLQRYTVKKHHEPTCSRHYPGPWQASALISVWLAATGSMPSPGHSALAGDGRIFLLGYGNYRLTPIPLTGYDPNRMDVRACSKVDESAAIP